MFKFTEAFSSFSIDDVERAKTFYSETLGLDVSEQMEGLSLTVPGAGEIFLYSKTDHEPATFTVLNFMVDDIETAVGELKELGVSFEQYEGDIKTDEKGIFRGEEGPLIAWFKDPAGNVLSVLEKQ